MRNIFPLLALCLILCKASSMAQAPDWQWARGTQNSDYAEASIATTDALGNLYLSGYWEDTISFSGISFIGGLDRITAFVAKYDSSGAVRWVKHAHGIGSSGYNLGLGSATDRWGYTYLTGFFNDSALSFDSDTLVNVGQNDILLVKYDSLGNLMWAKREGDVRDDRSYGIAIDPLGNVYITGTFNSTTITFGNYTLTNSGGFDVFIVKYDSSGTVLWAQNAIGNGSEIGYSIVSDTAGNVCLTGYFGSPSLSFGTHIINCLGTTNVFIARYDSTGNALWAKGAGGSSIDQGLFLATDVDQNIYLTGYYSSSGINFDSYSFTNAGGDDAFFVKYNPSGDVIWAKSYGGAGNEIGNNIAVDPLGIIYLSGGFLSDSITIDTAVLHKPTVGFDPAFIAGFDTSGNIRFEKTLPSGGDGQLPMAITPTGSLYACGDFYKVNPVMGLDTLHRTGTANLFLAKLSYDFPVRIQQTNKSNQFNLFPNPFHNQFFIEMNEDQLSEFSLFDISSRKVFQQYFEKPSSISDRTEAIVMNTNKIASGIYFYEIKTKAGDITRGKVVKN